MQRKEFEDLKQQRRLWKASLAFDPFFEELRKKFKLTHWQVVELLQEKAELYLKIAIKRMTRGKRR